MPPPTQKPICALALMMKLTGQARAFALPMPAAIVIATATARRAALDL
jgi:hypothetical protein